MLSVAFGQAKYYTDNLRENILRGIRQKIRRGELSEKHHRIFQRATIAYH